MTRTNRSHGISAGFALLTGGSVVLAVVHNLGPQVMTAPDCVFSGLFGVCLAASVAADWYCVRAPDLDPGNGAACIRRYSRLVYAWLYLLFGANEAAAGFRGCPIEAAAGGLRTFLLAGIAVLIMIRVAAFAVATVYRVRAPTLAPAGMLGALQTAQREILDA